MKKIAVVGSGISGLSCAWLLSKKHHVSLFESAGYLGGHSNTVDLNIDGKEVPVDTGFIVYNEKNYFNLDALLNFFELKSDETDMSFSASIDGGNYEYNGSLYGLFGQSLNLMNVQHWRMVWEILRFFREASGYLKESSHNLSLGELLKNQNFSSVFVHRHLLPMAAAIWSSSTEDMLKYPAAAFIRFFANHGLLQSSFRPKWRTVNGGSRQYVQKLVGDSQMDIHLNQTIKRINRSQFCAEIELENGEKTKYDAVVLACHADQALKLLDAPSREEEALLGAIPYCDNVAVLHSDKTFMPKRKRLWSSWNYMELSAANQREKEQLCVSYWMNALQKLPTQKDIFVTLNPPSSLPVKEEYRRFNYQHPVFNVESLEAQKHLWDLQGQNRTWFCGAYFGAGFHEDGLQAGLAVAETLGGMARPWGQNPNPDRIHWPNPYKVSNVAE